MLITRFPTGCGPGYWMGEPVEAVSARVDVRLLKLCGYRGEGVRQTCPEVGHGSDDRHSDQRRDEAIFESGDRAAVGSKSRDMSDDHLQHNCCSVVCRTAVMNGRADSVDDVPRQPQPKLERDCISCETALKSLVRRYQAFWPAKLSNNLDKPVFYWTCPTKHTGVRINDLSVLIADRR
jgi:hypothetical protein